MGVRVLRGCVDICILRVEGLRAWEGGGSVAWVCVWEGWGQ